MLGTLGSGLSGALKAAESYLGLSDTQIVAGLLSGRSLADLASAQGKTDTGLVSAVVAAERSQLAHAVKAGQITAAQTVTIESGLKKSLTNLVHARLPAGGLGALWVSERRPRR